MRSSAASTCNRSGRPSNDGDVANLSTMRPTMAVDMASTCFIPAWVSHSRPPVLSAAQDVVLRQLPEPERELGGSELVAQLRRVYRAT